MPRGEPTGRARSLRARQTRAEARLWNVLRDRRLGGWKWRRQAPIGRYVVDFLCLRARLVIELDGGGHADKLAYDERRTLYLRSVGLRVIRFSNLAVFEGREGVCDAILEACGGELTSRDSAERRFAPQPLTLPSPLERGEEVHTGAPSETESAPLGPGNASSPPLSRGRG